MVMCRVIEPYDCFDGKIQSGLMNAAITIAESSSRIALTNGSSHLASVDRACTRAGFNSQLNPRGSLESHSKLGDYGLPSLFL